jgi:cytochrome c-type biogenesis protein CcmH/NrfG
MNKDQVRFLVSGILFGFLVGYVIAYGVYEPGVVKNAAPVPAAGNMGMSPGGAAPAAAPTPPPGAPPGSEQMMAQVFQEISALRAAIEKNPKDADALTRMANIYHDAGKFDEAVGYYRRALELRPKDVDARTDMGICLRELGKTDDAIAQFRTSLSYDPNHWQTWLNLGVVSLFDKQDVDAADAAFKKVEALNPGYKDLPLLKDALQKARTPTGRPAS